MLYVDDIKRGNVTSAVAWTILLVAFAAAAADNSDACRSAIAMTRLRSRAFAHDTAHRLPIADRIARRLERFSVFAQRAANSTRG